MADTITIRTATERDVVKVVERGPQGPKGDKGDPGDVAGLPLSTQGDILYRGASENQRLPIGSTGQILKVSGGIPSWANESGAVTSVNGQTGAVTVAAEQHASEHESGGGDQLNATAALVTTDQSSLNGIYFSDDTSTNGRLNFFRTGTRKNTKLQFNSNTGRWELIQNMSVVGQSEANSASYPWTASPWEDPSTPPIIASITVTRVGLEEMVQKLAETGSAATATTSDDGLMSSSDKTKLNGIAAGAEVNVQSNWTEADSGSDAFIQNKPATFAPSAHSSSHAVGGSDPLAPSDIGAQSLFTSASQVLSADFTLTGGRATKWTLQNYNGTTYNITLPTTNIQTGDVVVIAAGTLVGSQTIREANVGGGSFATLATLSEGQSYRFVSTGSSSNSWEIDQVYTHSHAASDITSGTLAHERGGLEADVSAYNGLVKISGGSTSAVGIGTGSTEVAAGDHVHGNLSSDGKIGSTAGLPVVTTTAGAVTTLALGTAGQILRTKSDLSGVEFADPAASGGSKTYAVFTATDNNPPATAFATIDQRNSTAVLDFDAATDENAVFVGIMPEAASLGSGLIVRLHWMATSATSGNVRWGVQFERSNTDLDADSFDTAVEATAATNGTSGIITTTAITVTTIDGITAGDVFRLKVYRNADDVTHDTLSGDAELVACEVRSAA